MEIEICIACGDAVVMHYSGVWMSATAQEDCNVCPVDGKKHAVL